MRRYSKKFVFILFVIIFISQINSIGAQTFIIDNFDKEPTHVGQKYPNYLGRQNGYDIYSVKADVQLSHIPNNPKDSTEKSLLIKFGLPPALSWGNWISIRSEFKSLLNLEEYSTLKLNIMILEPAPGAFLRITLSDMTNKKKYGDEKWWVDSDLNLLRNKTTYWTTFNIPFNYFYISYGIGTRHNDFNKSLKRIIAYEINLVTESMNYPKGVILVDSLRAYREELLFFEFDNSNIQTSHLAILESYLHFLKNHSDVILEIEGHTDSIGSEEYNQLLSERRAMAVSSYLIRMGIEKNRINPIGYNYSMPITSNRTNEGRAKNRRVKFRTIN